MNKHEDKIKGWKILFLFYLIFILDLISNADKNKKGSLIVDLQAFEKQFEQKMFFY